jgi:hypothetical protein
VALDSSSGARRLPNWRSLLRTWADEQIGRPFVWGETDCCALTRGALSVMFGFDVVARQLGELRWTRSVEAYRVFHRLGGDINRVFAGFGAEERMFARSTRAGDLIVVPSDERVGRFCVLVSVDGINECLLSTRDAGVIAAPLAAVTGGDARVWSLWGVRGS